MRFRKAIAIVVLVAMMGSTVPVTADVSRNNRFVTEEETPTDCERGGTIWSRSFSDGSLTTYNSWPVITEDSIYIVSKDVLYVLDFDGNILRSTTLYAAMNSVCYMELYEGKLFIPLSGGCIECINVETLERLWVSDALGGQSLSYVTCYGGFVYAGTTETQTGGKTDGTFYCLDTRNGSVQWNYRNPENIGGYYWSGACVMDDRIYFAGDSGILVEHDLVQDVTYSETLLSNEGQIRSNLVYDEETKAIYTVSNVGEIVKYAEGEVSVWKLFPNAKVLNCTSTPTIVDGIAYIGAMSDGMGYICVWDISANALKYTVETGKGCEVKSTPLVSTAYGDKKYIYYTCNNLPGGIYYCIDTEDSVSGEQYTLYEPAVAKQYCISSIMAGAGGVLYYSNDTGTLFAVSEVERSSDYVEPVPTPAVSPKPDKTSMPGMGFVPMPKPTSMGAAAKPKKPSGVKIKKTAKGIRIRWKKGAGAAKTFVYAKLGKGKWKKLAATGKTSYLWKKNTKKMIRIRLRSGTRYRKKWYYSGWKSFRVSS